MTYLEELTRMQAPRKVVERDYAEFEESTLASAPRAVKDAIRECMTYQQANLPPPSELVSLIRGWVFKEQNRYGK